MVRSENVGQGGIIKYWGIVTKMGSSASTPYETYHELKKSLNSQRRDLISRDKQLVDEINLVRKSLREVKNEWGKFTKILEPEPDQSWTDYEDAKAWHAALGGPENDYLNRTRFDTDELPEPPDGGTLEGEWGSKESDHELDFREKAALALAIVGGGDSDDY